MKTNLITFSILLSIAVGCSQKPDRGEKSAQPTYPYINEVRRLEELSANFDSCDKRTLHLKKEIALALDNNVYKTKKYHKTQVTEGGNPHHYRLEKLGPTNLFVKNSEKKKTPVSASQSWQSFYKSWDTVEKLYNKTLKTDSAEDWLNLADKFHSILVDDQDRIINLKNMNLNKDSEKILSQLIIKIEKCSEAKSCTDKDFDKAELHTLKSFSIYQKYYSNIQSDSTDLNNYKSLIYELKNDYKAISFKKNKLIQKTADNQLSIVLFTQDFKGYEGLFDWAFTKYWEKNGIALNILWSESPILDVSKINFINQMGGRPYVYKFDMYLYPDPSELVLAHEFGHILGFRDFYYTQWDSANCQYKVEYNEFDLMSIGETVPQEHINKLKDEYLTNN